MGWSAGEQHGCLIYETMALTGSWRVPKERVRWLFFMLRLLLAVCCVWYGIFELKHIPQTQWCKIVVCEGKLNATTKWYDLLGHLMLSVCLLRKVNVLKIHLNPFYFNLFAIKTRYKSTKLYTCFSTRCWKKKQHPMIPCCERGVGKASTTSTQMHPTVKLLPRRSNTATNLGWLGGWSWLMVV